MKAIEAGATTLELDLQALGAALSVAEATRNVSVTGARPLGVTNCLNFGDPTRPEAFWQLKEAVRGLGDACRALGVPVTGGNVSLYNEAPGSAIAPTPVIGVVGLADDVDTLVGPAFAGDGEVVLLAGTTSSDAYLWAEKIRKNIAGQVITIGEKSFSVTISAGVSGVLEGMRNPELVGNTVAVLNRATEAGGNTVRVF